MLRMTMAAMTLLLGVYASATTINDRVLQAVQQILTSRDVVTAGLNFKEGDQASYSLKLSSFINGSMVMTVKSVAAEEVVISQDMDLGFAGKQQCEETINPNTGEIKKFVCNGQQQNPEKPDIEIIDTKEDSITVAAGTFTCLYVKAKNLKDNSIIQQWANLKQVPVFGMVKMISPTQMGEMNVELTAFKKN